MKSLRPAALPLWRTSALALTLFCGPRPASAAPGDLDTSFGPGSGIVLPAGISGRLLDVALQPDGKVVAAGYQWNETAAREELTLLRCLPGGAFDTSFGGDGTVTIPTGDEPVIGYAVVVRPDGRLLTAAVRLEGERFLYDLNYIVVQLLADGSLDTGFGSGGIMETGLRVENELFFEFEDADAGLALQADGRIVVAGRLGGDLGIMRALPGGTADAAFGGNGLVRIAFGTHVPLNISLRVLPDGKISVTTTSTDTFGTVGVARLLPNGSPDPTLDSDGKLLLILANGGRIYDHAVQPDGKIVLCGEEEFTAHLILMRLTPQGTLDSTFNGTGIVRTGIPDYSPSGAALALPGDGGIYVTGQAFGEGPNQSLLALYRADGSLDTAFGTGGLVLTPGYISAALTLQSDGRIVTAGTSDESPWTTALALARHIGLPLPPLAQWRAQHFGSSANSGPATDTADPDGDGIANLLECITGQNPRVNSAALFPAWTRTGNTFNLEFTAPATVGGVTLVAEHSLTLLPNSWTTISNSLTPPAYRFVAPPPAGGRGFVRLRATNP